MSARRYLPALLLAALPALATAATYTVTSASDSGANTLRWAIQQANANAGTDSIVFNIGGGGGRNIALATALPAITGPVSIDASTQPGYAGSPLIQLDGLNAGAGAIGLQLSSAGSSIRGFSVMRFNGVGIRIDGAGGGNTVAACHIGLNNAGGASGNGGSGVFIAGSPNNVIGPSNTIAGNGVDGVRIDAAAATGNVVAGNRIGTNPAGTAAIPNGYNGVVITAASNNRIGGTTAADLNVISGNTRNGIGIGGGASGNLVERNYIGLAADGASALGNGWNGVYIIDSPSNKIGGDVTGTWNIISANGYNGVELFGDGADGNIIQRDIIGSDLFGTLDRGNGAYGIQIDAGDAVVIGGGAWTQGGNLIAANGSGGIHLMNAADDILMRGNRIGSDYSGTAELGSGGNGVFVEDSARTVIGTTAEPNLISGHASGYGVYLWATTAARVVANLIGTTANGTSALPNQSGVVLGNFSTQNTIGGTGSARNIISGNSDIGIQIYFSTGNVVTGNWVGLGTTGAALGNGGDGLYMQANGSSPSNTIGGTAAGAGNVFSANGGHGIASVGTNTLIAGNFIGTNASGSLDIGNAGNGIHVIWSEGVVIGGSSPGARNVISGNAGNGVELSYGTESAPRQLLGNFIGVGANGLTAIANGGDGVLISDRGYNQVGAANAGNVISGNNGNGVRIASPNARVASIRGNFIGVGGDGTTVIGNGQHGIVVSDCADGNRIGGGGAGEGNSIRGNGGDGIYISASSNIEISGNSVDANGGLAIDLGSNGITPNDSGDGDSGPNDLQNYPVLTSALANATNMTVSGTLNSVANGSFRVEFFTSAACDGSGYGEGATFLGSLNLTANGSGNANLAITVPAASAPIGQFITATATRIDTGFGTSEFSTCRAVTADAPPAPTASNNGAICNRQTLQLTASTISGASYAWTGPNGFTSTLQNPTIANATTTATGTYSVTATIAGITGPAGTTTATVNNCQISINDPAAIVEGTGSNSNASFTVSLSHASKTAITLNWASVNGTATAPADYGNGAGTLTIAANATTATINRPVIGDSLDENDENFHIDLSNASAGSLSDSRGTATITDDDSAPTVSIADKSCVEGNTGSTACSFTIILSAASGRSVGGTYASAGGGATPATAGADYTAVAATAWTIAAGATTTTASVNVLGDALDEANETFLINLAGLTNAAASGNDTQATATITDDDNAPTLSIDNGGCSVIEGDTGSVNCAFALRLSAASGKTVSFSTATANGTATAGSDYTAHAATARSIAAGSTTLTVNVPVLGDTIEEADETFTLNVTVVTNASPTSLSGTGSILSDDLAELIHFDGFE